MQTVAAATHPDNRLLKLVFRTGPISIMQRHLLASSRTVLDCMEYGIPLVVSENGLASTTPRSGSPDELTPDKTACKK